MRSIRQVAGIPKSISISEENKEERMLAGAGQRVKKGGASIKPNIPSVGSRRPEAQSGGVGNSSRQEGRGEERASGETLHLHTRRRKRGPRLVGAPKTSERTPTIFWEGEKGRGNQ